jgi:predicted RNase H-like HicB family nuclease
MNMKIYPAIFKHHRLDGYTARFHDIPGCMAQGDTMEDATQAAKVALGKVLAAMAEAGRPIPPPSGLTGITLRRGEFIVMVTADMDEYSRGRGPRIPDEGRTLWPSPGRMHPGVRRRQ